jgi:phospholipid:diacylglycerol acyltransferase
MFVVSVSVSICHILLFDQYNYMHFETIMIHIVLFFFFLQDILSTTFHLSCEGVGTECNENEMRRESIPNVGKRKASTGRTDLDLLNFVAPKMMKRAEAHFSHGIADNLDDPKYTHYKYWSNPLETK